MVTNLPIGTRSGASYRPGNNACRLRTCGRLPRVPPLTSFVPLFIAPLYDRLRPLRGQLTIGFADDTNILAFHRHRPGCVCILEEAYRIAAQWAAERGAAFEPAKSELIHFKRRGSSDTNPTQLGPH